jgi:hypothetical protein
MDHIGIDVHENASLLAHGDHVENRIVIFPRFHGHQPYGIGLPPVPWTPNRYCGRPPRRPWD